MSGLGRNQSNDHPPRHTANSGPSPVVSASSQSNTATGVSFCQGRLELACEGAPLRQQKGGCRHSSLGACPPCLPPCLHTPVIHNLCHHASEAQEQGFSSSSPASGDHQELRGAMAPSSPDAGPFCTGSDEGAQGPEEESVGASQAAPATQITRKDPPTPKASMLVGFLLDKYPKQQPLTQNTLLKVVSRKYRQHFPKILRRASERVELVFGLELMDVDRSTKIYALISKLNLRGDEGPSDEGGLPKSGLLMVLLGIIFRKSNHATGEGIWELLCVGVYAGWRHWIFGETRRLITKDLVQRKYLKYRPVPNSDSPCYEFLWGPRASCAETSKMKVLEVLAKILHSVPSSFPDLYEEALRDQAERAGPRGAARTPTMARPVPLPGPSPAAPPTSREAGRALCSLCVGRQQSRS
ncbi:LOW QUALITY PROTEIN: melanoma-associated antigen B4-like [Cervus canadensis]|uniref:LOW QUALITY PROTEIN: melanoma-associated antigen B4-like n=1 Tax=Cervus canadensis TaxID=1574408 RepID=UPI001CA31A93|nr:LOW QUALITY PROTEIN: melanoma-associated antigen B4-like [Cervus canadensis]